MGRCSQKGRAVRQCEVGCLRHQCHGWAKPPPWLPHGAPSETTAGGARLSPRSSAHHHRDARISSSSSRSWSAASHHGGACLLKRPWRQRDTVWQVEEAGALGEEGRERGGGCIDLGALERVGFVRGGDQWVWLSHDLPQTARCVRGV